MTNENKKLKIAVGILSALLGITLIGGGIFMFILFDRNTKLETAVDISTTSVEFQRSQKDEIRNLWEESNARNDDLIFSQIQLFNRLERYQELITESIGFDGQATIVLKNINKGNLKNAEDEVYSILEDIDDLIENNSNQKGQEKDVVDNLYIEAEEDQKNRINYIDGLR